MALRGTADQVNLSSATTVVVTVTPIGITLGDLILWGVVGGGGPADTFTPPAGWNLLTGFTNQNLGGNATATCYFKVATATEVSASTLIMTVSQNDFHAAVIAVFSGRSGAFTAIAQTAPVSGAASPVTFARTGVTAAAGDDIAVFDFINGLGAASNTLTFTPPAGYGDALHPNPSVSFAQTLCYCDFPGNGGGATGTLAGTLSNSSSASANYGSLVVAMTQSGAPSNTASIAWVS
jgi:hypothetical protein